MDSSRRMTASTTIPVLRTGIPAFLCVTVCVWHIMWLWPYANVLGWVRGRNLPKLWTDSFDVIVCHRCDVIMCELTECQDEGASSSWEILTDSSDRSSNPDEAQVAESQEADEYVSDVSPTMDECAELYYQASRITGIFSHPPGQKKWLVNKAAILSILTNWCSCNQVCEGNKGSYSVNPLQGPSKLWQGMRWLLLALAWELRTIACTLALQQANANKQYRKNNSSGMLLWRFTVATAW